MFNLMDVYSSWLTFSVPAENCQKPDENTKSSPSLPPKSKLIRFQEYVMRKSIQATKVLHHVMVGVVTREKIGPEVICDLNGLHFDENDGIIEQFRNYDITPKPPSDKEPLNPEQVKKLEEFIAEETNTKKRQKYQEFLERATHEHATRLDFIDSDWKILGRICFSLASDYLRNLPHLFNSSLLDNHQQEMREQFGVNYKEAVIAEVLAKTVAYASGLGGQTIELPVEKDGSYSLVTYKIQDFRIGDDLPCYVLESDDPEAQPWFVARGTNLQGYGNKGMSVESIFADVIDENGLAGDIVIKAMFNECEVKENGCLVRKSTLLSLFENWNEEGKKPNLCGHSLGGYLITDITVRLNPLVEKAYAFSSMGTSYDLEEQWSQIVENDPEQADKIVNFACEGDLVPSSGRKLIDLHIAITPNASHPFDDPIHSHMRMLLNRNFNAQAVDIIVENSKLSRRIAESTRVNFGRLLRGLVTLFKKEALPDWWVSRHVYRQALLEYQSRTA